MNNSLALKYLNLAKEYADCAHRLYKGEVDDLDRSMPPENARPIYYLALHSTELAVKSLLESQSIKFGNEHDLCLLVAKLDPIEQRRCLRKGISVLRDRRRLKVERKWDEMGGEFSQAACRIETESRTRLPVRFFDIFLRLNALGKDSKLKKIEFGEEVTNWWYALRYPTQANAISFPDFEDCLAVNDAALSLAEEVIE